MQQLKVWWIPQVPMKAFEVKVSSVAEGVKIMDVLADYDNFQYANNVKPDYCGAGGLLMMHNGEWIDWSIETEDDFFDDPTEYLDWYNLRINNQMEGANAK